MIAAGGNGFLLFKEAVLLKGVRGHLNDPRAIAKRRFTFVQDGFAFIGGR